MAWYVGTSGFGYKEWKGVFYPADLPDRQMLAWYGERLPAVEINNTFYRMPRQTVLETWAADVPDGFRFVIKASRRITHFKRLNDTAEPMGYLLTNLAVLGDKLGAVLFQLPPNMRCNVERLSRFVDLMPADVRAAFEFRHESWFDEEVFECLRSRNMAICHAEDADSTLPLVSTADWGYLRLRRPRYDKRSLGKWLKRMGEEGWEDTFVFFKHEDEGVGPKMAMKFLDQALPAH